MIKKIVIVKYVCTDKKDCPSAVDCVLQKTRIWKDGEFICTNKKAIKGYEDSLVDPFDD